MSEARDIRAADGSLLPGACFVHCDTGNSRAAAAVMALVMGNEHRSLHHACHIIATKRPSALPNNGLLSMLHFLDRDLFNRESIQPAEIAALLGGGEQYSTESICRFHPSKQYRTRANSSSSSSTSSSSCGDSSANGYGGFESFSQYNSGDPSMVAEEPKLLFIRETVNPEEVGTAVDKAVAYKAVADTPFLMSFPLSHLSHLSHLFPHLFSSD
jgi:hypothetical protein